jgi:hypothetical protein
MPARRSTTSSLTSASSPPRAHDLVLCLGVLAHVESVDLVVAKAAESCAPGALCILQLSDSRHPLAKAMRLYDKARGRLRRDRRYETARMSVQDVVDQVRVTVFAAETSATTCQPCWARASYRCAGRRACSFFFQRPETTREEALGR